MRQKLRRRINQVNLKKFAENQFWRQAQPILSDYLLNSDYKCSLYVEPYLGESDKKLSDDVSDFLERPKDPWTLLMVGQYGVGKSSALNHFAETVLKVKDGIKNDFAWIYYDGNKTLLDVHTKKNLIESLSNVVARVTGHYLAQKGIDRDSFYDMVFRDDENFERLRSLEADLTPATRQRVKEALAADANKHLLVNLRFLVRQLGKGRVVVVLDNLDPLNDDVQFQGVTLASHLSTACRVKTIVAVRRSTDTALRKNHPEAISIVVETYVNAPSMATLIKKRVDQALLEEESKLGDISLGDGALVAKLSESPELSEVLAKGLSLPRVSAFLNGIANDSVREGLHCAHTIYSSHFLDARKILKKLSPVDKVVPSLWHGHIPYAIVVKALMFNNSQVYEPGREIGNIFGTYRSSSDLGPYLRLLILKYIRKEPEGTLDVQHLKANIKEILHSEPADIDNELAWLAKQLWIESLPEDKVQLTVRGKFFADGFRNDIEYLTHISIDVDMYEAMEARLRAPADNPQQRLNNLVVLVEYLMERELQMLLALTKDGSLDDYVASFGSLPITADMLTKIIYEAHQMRAWADADRDDLDAVQALPEKLSALQEGKIAREILRVIKEFTSEG